MCENRRTFVNNEIDGLCEMMNYDMLACEW